MAAILIVDCVFSRAEELAHLLLAEGHAVTIEPDSFKAREQLSGPSYDLLIVDASMPDGGAGLLIAQARLAWTRTPVLAIVDGEKLRMSKLAEMGLWAPDAVVESPCTTGAITFTASRLLKLNRHLDLNPTEAANDSPCRRVTARENPAR